MRHRQQLVIDRQTGEASLTAVAIDDDAGFTQRVFELQSSVPDIGPVEARSLTAVCDGCGTRADLDFDAPELPDRRAAASRSPRSFIHARMRL